MTGFVGPRGVAAFRTIVLRSAVKLESVGLKSRGGSKRALAIRELGLKRNATYDEVLVALDQAIEDAKAALQPGDVVP